MLARIVHRKNMKIVHRKNMKSVHRKSTMIADDHLAKMEAILARDQRTTFHRVADRVTPICAPASTAVLLSQGTKSQEDSKGHYAKEKKKRGEEKVRISARRYSKYIPYLLSFVSHRRNARLSSPTTWLSLGCFLTLLVSVNSNPVMSSNKETASKWQNPCGLSTTTNIFVEDSFERYEITSDKDLLIHIKMTTDMALDHLHQFINDYTNYTLHHNFIMMNNTWSNQSYDWLPNLPKSVGGLVDHHHLKNLKIDELLSNMYKYLQTFAVGLDQIVDDSSPSHKYHQHLSETENKLRAILCEVQNALAERTVTPQPDVTRDIMPIDIREIVDETHRSLRNFLILRAYMNNLEYIQQTLDYLIHRLKNNHQVN